MPLPAYPEAPRRTVRDHLHDRWVADPYRWLEDPASPATVAWGREQDELWRRWIWARPGIRRWHERVAERSATGSVTAPVWRGADHFHLRQEPDREHAALLRTAPDGTDTVLLDPCALDPAGGVALQAWHVDREGRRVAVQLCRRGDERAELTVLDAADGTPVDGPIPGCRFSPVAWLPGGGAFFHVRTGPDGRRRVLRHVLGTPHDDDEVVLGDEHPPGTPVGVGLGTDGRRLVVSAARDRGNDLWIADVGGPGDPVGPLRPVQTGRDHAAVAATGPDGRLYVVTDAGAPRGRICVTDPDDPGPDTWQNLVVPASPDVLVDFAILDPDRPVRPLLLVTVLRGATSAVGVHDLATGEHLRDVPLPGTGSVGSLSARPDGGDEAWFGYTDRSTPQTVYRYDAASGTTSRWAGPPGGPDTVAVQTRELRARSADGTEVDAVVLRRADAGPGPRPLLVYGYGGFGIPLTPSYSAFAAAWLDAGGVFATAHGRGGGEHGADWHRAGSREGKQNGIDDVVAVARRLVDDGWTTPDRLAACGESGGGLLVAAAATQHPELFAAVACVAAPLDMVRYEHSGLGHRWRGEFGSASDPEQLGWLLGYSPYHAVRAGTRYPATVLVAGDQDARVDPLHARKMCAALQWATPEAAARPVLLRRDTDAGHSAGSTSAGVALSGDLLAFLAEHTGLAPPGPASRTDP